MPRPTLIAANDGQGDFAFLNLTAPAFDLTDRGVSGRPAPNGLDAFVYAERGVYRSGETAYLTALLRDAQGAASPGVPLTFVVERPDGVEYRRSAGAGPGLGRPWADLADRGLGADRHLARARLHRPEARGGRRDDVPGRGLCARADRIRSVVAERDNLQNQSGHHQPCRPLPLRRAGLEPRSRRRHEHRRGGGALRLCRLSVRPRRRRRRRRAAAAGRSAVDRRRRQGDFQRQYRQAAVEHASARSAHRRAHGRAGRPRRRAQDHAAGHGERQHDRRQAAVRGPLAGRRRQRRVRRRGRCAQRHRGRDQGPALRAVARRNPLSIL